MFQDIEDHVAESSSDSESEDEMPVDHVLWNDMINDKSFLSLLDMSEWNVDSTLNGTDNDDIPDNVDITNSVAGIVNDILEAQFMEK